MKPESENEIMLTKTGQVMFDLYSLKSEWAVPTFNSAKAMVYVKHAFFIFQFRYSWLIIISTITIQSHLSVSTSLLAVQDCFHL